MLRSVKDFENFKLRASDGDIGKVREFLFDDKYWTVRYLVADTGGWLTGRRVLLSPYALHSANEVEQVLPVDLTKKQIAESPSLASDEPVSRQYEVQYYGYYGWPIYWGGAHMWGISPHMWGADSYMGGVDLDMDGIRAAQLEAIRREESWDPHLRSTGDVTGHHIQALDGEIGHVEDFIIDDETWTIRYLVVDTKNWWPGKKVLVSPQWIDNVSWNESKVFVDLPRKEIRQGPEYTDWSLLTREFESILHQHYKRPGYWVSDPVDNKQPL